jgi:hypothetical protein
MKNRSFLFPIFFVIAFTGSSYLPIPIATNNTGMLKISFINTVKGSPLQLRTGNYTNPFDEQYSVSKFKYYISNIALAFPDGIFSEKDSYHLVDESKPESLSFGFYAIAGTYHSFLFMVGVDSIKNVSGAQTGALDPLNDMFWTWNTGYVMAKMEGNSPQSGVVNNKVELHIGGFSGNDNVLKKLKLDFPAGQSLEIREGKTSEIVIEADLDKWWKGANDLKIAEHAICTTPGTLAKKIADNYSRMFTIKRITNN